MADLVVDTDVVSFGFRQHELFTDKYGPALQGHRAVVSFMTLAELHFGALNRQWGRKRQEELQSYLDRHYVRCWVSEEMCRAWADLIWQSKQQGRIMSGADAWIAATAVTLDVPLVTHNAKDYRHLTELQLVSFAAS